MAAVEADGSLSVTDAERGSLRLPAQYVARHVELGWAVTGYGNQGVTVDHGICVLEPASTRAGIYVAMTRGKPALAAAGLPQRVRFHDMRHTCAALLINADPPAHPLAVMKRLGHSSITVTYNTYGHLFPALEAALTESLDRSYQAAQAAGSLR